MHAGGLLDSSGEGGDVKLKKEDEEKAQLARLAAEEELRKQEEERRNIRIAPGDYQIQVKLSGGRRGRSLVRRVVVSHRRR